MFFFIKLLFFKNNKRTLPKTLAITKDTNFCLDCYFMVRACIVYVGKIEHMAMETSKSKVVKLIHQLSLSLLYSLQGWCRL